MNPIMKEVKGGGGGEKDDGQMDFRQSDRVATCADNSLSRQITKNWSFFFFLSFLCGKSKRALKLVTHVNAKTSQEEDQ